MRISGRLRSANLTLGLDRWPLARPWVEQSDPSDVASTATCAWSTDRAATTAPARPDWAPRSPMRISGDSGHRSATRRRKGSKKAGASSVRPPERAKASGSSKAEPSSVATQRCSGISFNPSADCEGPEERRGSRPLTSELESRGDGPHYRRVRPEPGDTEARDLEEPPRQPP